VTPRKFLTVCAITIATSGCCTAPPYMTLPIPKRLQVLDWTQEEWNRLPPDAQDKIDYNAEQFKRMIVEREAVIRGHNDGL
jgi:hypothetical protein